MNSPSSPISSPASEQVHALKPALTIPLCVDLDGTLIKTDLLYEVFVKALLENPMALVWGAIALCTGGIAAMKRSIATAVPLTGVQMPIREDVFDYIKSEKELGREVILISASDASFVKEISEDLGCFSDAIGSDGTTNLLGEQKAKYLVDRFGEKKFDYIGNSNADIKVWKHSREALVVAEGGEDFVRRAEAVCKVSKVFPCPSFTGRIVMLLRAMRLHQWVKNALLFVPLVMAHRAMDIPSLIGVFQGFAAFCLIASSVYLTNDMADLAADRAHPRKKRRPFASGDLPLQAGLVIAPVLIILGFTLGLAHPSPQFLPILGCYFLTTVAYSFYLKRLALVDIIVLAGLYSIRVLAGGIAGEVPVSQWLLAFCMFLFFSLACVKRFSELMLTRQQSKEATQGRGYLAQDLEVIGQCGVSSGYISILVFALYLHSAEVSSLYSSPKLLWLIGPLLFYWISRVWLLTTRGDMHDDPIVFAIKDRVSYVIGVLAIVFVCVAR